MKVWQHAGGQRKHRRNAEIVALYKGGMTQGKIGERYGISQSRVGQIIRKWEKEGVIAPTPTWITTDKKPTCEEEVLVAVIYVDEDLSDARREIGFYDHDRGWLNSQGVPYSEFDMRVALWHRLPELPGDIEIVADPEPARREEPPVMTERDNREFGKLMRQMASDLEKISDDFEEDDDDDY